jgi:hypothetical protein
MMKIAEAITIKYAAELSISMDRVQGVLCAALEGGSNYWIDSVEIVYPEGHNPEDYKVGGKHHIDDLFDSPLYNVWRFHGGKLIFYVDMNEDGKLKKYELNLNKVIDGFRQMAAAEKCRADYWPNFVKENDDADTADCWLQLALFNDIIFG